MRNDAITQHAVLTCRCVHVPIMYVCVAKSSMIAVWEMTAIFYEFLSTVLMIAFDFRNETPRQINIQQNYNLWSYI